MKLRLGIIGTGPAWTTRHGPALRMLGDRFDVRAVFSPTVRLAENVATEFQADVIDGYRAMVSRSDIDAVLVLQKTWLGWLPMLAAAEAGKAIYWAGPCDLNPEIDGEVRDCIDKSGVSMMVEFPRRYAPATLRLKELIATHLGPPGVLFCHRRLPLKGDQTARQTIETERAEMLELIDWCRYVVGRSPVSVLSSGHFDEIGNRDYRVMTLQFDARGKHPAVTAQISCGTYMRHDWSEAIAYQSPSAMQVSCQNGIAFVNLPSSLVWFDEAGRHLESLESETPVGQLLLSHFHRAVTSLLRNVGDLGDAFAAAQILCEAERSESEGRRIEL